MFHQDKVAKIVDLITMVMRFSLNRKMASFLVCKLFLNATVYFESVGKQRYSRNFKKIYKKKA